MISGADKFQNFTLGAKLFFKLPFQGRLRFFSGFYMPARQKIMAAPFRITKQYLPLLDNDRPRDKFHFKSSHNLILPLTPKTKNPSMLLTSTSSVQAG